MELPLIVQWNVDPVFFKIGSVEIRYYGLFWALAFGMGLYIFSKIIKREGLPDKVLDSSFWYATLATVIGARLGHCFFYDAGYYVEHLWEVLNLREGGLASHGAAIGLLIGLYLFSRRNRLPYIWALDRIGIVVAIGGAAIRIGNLMNSEIYGDPTSLPWGFVFLRNGEIFASHPTQIYEAVAYLAIFGLLFYQYFGRNLAVRRPGIMFGWFLILLFGVRFLIETIKIPQEAFEVNLMQQIGMNMGQLLSLPFVALGAVILYWGLRGQLPRFLTYVKSNPTAHGRKAKK